jgi:hypothetical protein
MPKELPQYFIDAFRQKSTEETEALEAEARAEQASIMRRRAAEAEVMRERADTECPQTVKDFGARHGIERFAELTWMDGFTAGYAAGLARLARRRAEED